MTRKLQALRPNPYKPSVTKGPGIDGGRPYWWAKVKAPEGNFICEPALNWREAFDKALKMAEDAA